MPDTVTKQTISRFSVIVIIPLVLAILLVPFSRWIGWNIMTLIVFWFVLVPVVSAYLPKRISGSSSGLMIPLIGLSLFYLVMVLMTYSFYQTDYFKLMMISWVVNIGLVALITLSLKPIAKPLEV